MNDCSLTGTLPESMGSLANLGKSRRMKRRVLCCSRLFVSRSRFRSLFERGK